MECYGSIIASLAKYSSGPLDSTALEGWKSDFQKDWMSFKMLQKIRGTAVAFSLAEPKARLYIRAMTEVITELDKIGWAANMSVSPNEKLKKEFRVWLDLEQVRMSHVWRPEMLRFEAPSRVSFTDSSIFAWGIVYFTTTGKRKRYTRYIPEEYIDLPIHIKEILAIIQMLKEEPLEFADSTIIHYCDNQGVALGYRNLGVPSPELNHWITQLYEMLHEIRSVMRCDFG